MNAENVCRALAPLSASWSWEDRFGAMVAAFASTQQPEVDVALAEHFGERWDSARIASAPPRVRAILGRLGGLRADQRLHTREVEGGVLVWCALWPWQSGTRFSLRVGVDDPSIDPRPWF